MRKICDMKFYRESLYLVFTWLLFSCSDQMDRTMRVACGNAVELQRVLNYYEADDPNEMKREAAEFLIENMAGHGSVASPAVDSLACKVRQTEKINTDSVQTWWKTYKRYDTSAKELDSQTLKADFLIDNIDQAYKVWQTSPWRGEVSKSLFFRYVLPYRLREEPLAEIGWRDSLYQRYHPLIEGVTDLNRAFAIINKSIHKEFAMRDISFPYSLNVLDAGKMRIGKCAHQCQYIALVMRSLGIPAVVDDVNRWANYSMVGHSWVALVKQDGVYTVIDGDSIARRGNPINSTVFSAKYPLEKDYTIDTNFKKRVVKVWRMNYEQNVNRGFADKMADEKTKSLFSYPFQLLPYRLLLVAMIAYSVSESADRITPARMSFYGVVVASVLVSAYSEGQIRSRVNAVEAYHGIEGIGSVNLLSDYYVLLPMLNDCPDFLFDFAKGLTSAKRYNDSNAMLQQGTMVSADPMFYVCMGNNYSEMSLFKQAEECYTHAMKMVPNRLYPLYKLMKLYETCSNREACHRMARRVTAFREKVSSPAVREMKTEAKQICEQYEKR